MRSIKNQPKFSSPRMLGIYEQYRRAKRFVGLAHRCRKPVAKFTNLIAVVYPARAIVELMLEAAEKQELKPFQNKDAKESRKKFEEELAPKLPYYYLLEKIRIHDFHRFGCLPPSQRYQKTFVGGPIKLVARNGIAAISLMAEGPEYIKTGKSSVKEQRPLYTKNDLFYDEESEKYVPLDKILNDFLSVVPGVIEFFLDCCRRVE
jgi:hypothetical protein